MHDSNSFNDEKITELYIKFGYEGLGLFYTILEKFAGQEQPIRINILKKQLNVGKKLRNALSLCKILDSFSHQMMNVST